MFPLPVYSLSHQNTHTYFLGHIPRPSPALLNKASPCEELPPPGRAAPSPWLCGLGLGVKSSEAQDIQRADITRWGREGSGDRLAGNMLG